MRVEEFPDDLLVPSHLERAAGFGFSDGRIGIRQALCSAEKISSPQSASQLLLENIS